MTLKELNNKLIKLLDNRFTAELSDKVGALASKQIKTRTRDGLGVSENNQQEANLTPLSPKYIKQRERLKRQGKLSADTTPNKSNLTKSGEMLDNIKYTSTQNSATVFIASTDEKKAKMVQKKRPFFALSQKELTEINNLINKEINNDITKKGL